MKILRRERVAGLAVAMGLVLVASASHGAPPTGGYGAPAPVAVAAPAADDLLQKMSVILQKAPAEGDWQIKAADLAKMMAEKKSDFLVVDVRPMPPGQQGGKIAGALYIPYQDILKAENLARLPKDKTLVLVCMTGQLQNLPVLVLRALGYQAVTLKYGHAAWIKGYFGAKFMQDAIAGANYPFEP